MGHVDKSLLEVGGKTIIQSLLKTLDGLFFETIMVNRARDGKKHAGIRMISDIHKARCSLTGIHSALYNSRTEHVFITSCDTPFLSREMVRSMTERLRPEDDVLIPTHENGRMEPLCAIYSKRCLPLIKRNLDHGIYQIIRFFPEVRVSKVSTCELEKFDPGLESFINVNTPEELETACHKAQER